MKVRYSKEEKSYGAGRRNGFAVSSEEQRRNARVQLVKESFEQRKKRLYDDQLSRENEAVYNTVEVCTKKQVRPLLDKFQKQR